MQRASGAHARAVQREEGVVLDPFAGKEREGFRMRQKYRDRVPVIVQKASGSVLPDIDKNKFLVPEDVSFAQFTFVVRKRIRMRDTQNLFLICNRKIPLGETPMRVVYDQCAAQDGFLYVRYALEDTFG